MSFTSSINKLLSGKLKPVFYGLAAGLYPVFFYYSNNYALVKSYKHLLFFASVFLLIPIAGFWIASVFFNLLFLKKFKKYLFPFLNVWVFLTLLLVCIYAGISIWYIVLTGSIAIIIALLFYKHSSKIVIFQFILAFLGLFTLIPTLIKQQSFSKEWKKQPDDIASVQFKKKPNVYFIQPDGYVNTSELIKGYYKINNSKFENFLKQNKFTFYPDFRSNYASTLPSNSSVFMMKHHYYNKAMSDEEGMDGRSVIISNNTTLSVFKNNGYKTYFLTESPYFLMNFPKIGYDYANFSVKDIPIISKGTNYKRDVVKDFKKVFNKSENAPRFFFIQILKPAHISNSFTDSKGIAGEKEIWLKKLQTSNQRLTEIISTINKTDPNAIVIIMADHGGYIGMASTKEAQTKTQNRDKIYSIFSNLFAIKGVDTTFQEYNKNLKTSVNVFRVLFSYLSENKKYLTHLQDDGSYIIIYRGAPRGIYQYIDDSGNVVFNKVK